MPRAKRTAGDPTVEPRPDTCSVERDGLNASATGCSTDVPAADLEVAQPHQGDESRERDAAGKYVPRSAATRARQQQRVVQAQAYRLSATSWRRAAKQRAFLEDFAQWGNLTSASRAAGVSRNTVYRWQETDEAFLAAFKQADAAATERLEREAWRRAVDGSPYERTSYWKGEPVGTDRKIEYSDQLMMLLLRARRPDLYREKVDLAVTSVIKTIAGVAPESVL